MLLRTQDGKSWAHYLDRKSNSWESSYIFWCLPSIFYSPKDLNLIHVIQFNTEGKRRSYFHSINLRLTLNISTLAHSLCDSYHGHSQPQAGKGEKESCNLIWQRDRRGWSRLSFYRITMSSNNNCLNITFKNNVWNKNKNIQEIKVEWLLFYQS